MSLISRLDLPPGQPLYGDQPEGSAAVLWATDEPVEAFAEIWTALREPAQELGLVPLQLSGLSGDPGDRPWDSREFSPSSPAGIDARPAEDLLGEWWTMSVPDPEEGDEETAELLSPFTREFPGLAPVEDRSLDRADLTPALSLLPGGRLGLVTAKRPADALAVLGCTER